MTTATTCTPTPLCPAHDHHVALMRQEREDAWAALAEAKLLEHRLRERCAAAEAKHRDAGDSILRARFMLRFWMSVSAALVICWLASCAYQAGVR